jgi:hypothetical protein
MPIDRKNDRRRHRHCRRREIASKQKKTLNVPLAFQFVFAPIPAAGRVLLSTYFTPTLKHSSATSLLANTIAVLALADKRKEATQSFDSNKFTCPLSTKPSV